MGVEVIVRLGYSGGLSVKDDLVDGINTMLVHLKCPASFDEIMEIVYVGMSMVGSEIGDHLDLDDAHMQDLAEWWEKLSPPKERRDLHEPDPHIEETLRHHAGEMVCLTVDMVRDRKLGHLTRRSDGGYIVGDTKFEAYEVEQIDYYPDLPNIVLKGWGDSQVEV